MASCPIAWRVPLCQRLVVVPVIAFDHGGAAEIIACPPDVTQEKATGQRVPLRDVTAMADAIRDLMQMTPQARRQMGKMGRKRIEKHFSQKQMITETISVYERVLGL